MKSSTPDLLNAAKVVVQRFMYARVGYAGGLSFADLSTLTGIKENRLYKMRAGAVTPGIGELVALMRHLGPEFTNQLIALAGQGGAHFLDGDGCPLKAAEATSEFEHTVLAALTDERSPGRIDHLEEPLVLEKAQRAAPLVNAVASRRRLSEVA